MPQRNRRTLSALILTVALVPALPSPSQAAGLWDWDPARLAAQAWSWLEELGLLAREATTPVTQWEKEGPGINPDGLMAPTGTTNPPVAGGANSNGGN